MTKYENFIEDYKNNPVKFKEKLKESGIYESSKFCKELRAFQNQLNLNKLISLFGYEDLDLYHQKNNLARHIAEKFSKNRNLLDFFNSVDPNIEIFIIYQIKTNKNLIRL